jgi:hypothetical protein
MVRRKLTRKQTIVHHPQKIKDWRVFYKKQELLTLREHLRPARYFGEVCVAHLFSAFCVCLCIVASNAYCFVLFVLFVFVFCVMVSNTYIVLFFVLFVFVLCLVYPILRISPDCQLATSTVY